MPAHPGGTLYKYISKGITKTASFPFTMVTGCLVIFFYVICHYNPIGNITHKMIKRFRSAEKRKT